MKSLLSWDEVRLSSKAAVDNVDEKFARAVKVLEVTFLSSWQKISQFEVEFREGFEDFHEISTVRKWNSTRCSSGIG
jgi:hypothetical protein